MPSDALDTDDELMDPSFDLDTTMKSDTDYMTDEFCDNWVLQLDKEDRVNLGLFLCFQLEKVLPVGYTKAAEYAALMIGRMSRQCVSGGRISSNMTEQWLSPSKAGIRDWGFFGLQILSDVEEGHICRWP